MLSSVRLRPALENEIDLLERQFVRILQRKVFDKITACRDYNKFKATLYELTHLKNVTQLFFDAEKDVLGKDLGKTILAKKFSTELRDQDLVDFFKKLMFFNDSDPNFEEKENQKKFKDHLKNYIQDYALKESALLSVMFNELNTSNEKCIQFIWGAARSIYDKTGSTLSIRNTFKDIIAVFQWLETREVIQFTRAVLANCLNDDDKDDKSAGKTLPKAKGAKPTDELGKTIAYMFEMGDKIKTRSSSPSPRPSLSSISQDHHQTQAQNAEPSQRAQVLPKSPIRVGVSGPTGISFGA